MLLKIARLKIEASDTVANYINRDFLLRGSKKNAFKENRIGKNLIKTDKNIDIIAELENKNPEEWVIFRARAIDAGGSEESGEVYWGANDNGDYFSEEELLSLLEDSDKRSFETFIGVPVFVNHENDNVENARGKIVNSFYDKDNHCVWVDGMIDARAYPELARAVKEGYVSDVSMGCAVKYSHCSYCGHKAINESDYCTHVKNHKGRKLNGKKVYEENHGIKFIELSAVVDGACENCTIHSVFSGPELIDKVKEMCKVASSGNEYEISDKNKIKLANRELSNSRRKINALKDAGIVITARGEDIDKLNKSLDLLKEVSRQILESKDVDYEFLADIGDLLSELQNLIVDLVEAGFANQNQTGSNVSDEEVFDAISETGAPETGTPGVETTTPEVGNPVPTPQTPEQPPSAGTTPIASHKNKLIKTSESIKDFKEILSKIENIVKEIRTADFRGKEMPSNKELKRLKEANDISSKLEEIIILDDSPLVFHNGDYTALIDNEGITAFANGRKISHYSNKSLGEEIVKEIKKDPKKIASNFIHHIAKKFEGDNNMDKLKKEALIQNPPPVDQVQEGQLEDLDGNFERKNDTSYAEGQVGVTTEGQLENVPKSKETGKGDWNRVRPDNGRVENLVVTEGQLDNPRPTDYGSERTMSGKATLEGQHKGIQEWQLTQQGYGSERWDDEMRENYLPTTEAQFEGKDRVGQALDEVQEGQLNGRRQGEKMATASDFSDKVITAFVNGLSHAVTNFNVSPKTLASIKPNSQNIREAKISLSGMKDELSKKDIQKIAEYSISRAIGVNQDLAEPYIDEVIDVLYEDNVRLASAIKNTVDERISRLQKVATGEENVKTIESRIKNVWNKKTAAPIKAQKYIFTLNEIRSSIPEGKAPEITAKSINEPAVKALLENYISDGKGSVSVTNANIDESGVITVYAQDNIVNENSESVKNPSMDSPQIESEPISNNEIETENSEQISQPEMQIAASTKEKLRKLAQNPAGTTLPPPGGAMGGPAGGAPPAEGIESLAPPETGDFEEEPVMEDEGDSGLGGEAQPFGAISPISGSDDVEFVDGVYKDNTTGVEYTVDVNYRILNPHVLKNPGFMEKEEEIEPEEDMTEGEGVNEELNANPTGMEAPAVPGGQPAGGGAPGGGGGLGGGLMANAPSWVKTANFRYDITLDPMLFNSNFVETKVNGKLKKVAIYKPGHLCPQCGSKHVAFGGKNHENQGECANCGTRTYVHASKKEDGNLRVQMVVDNNLELKEAENDWGGHAFNGQVANRKEIQNKIHQILSSRRNFLKTANLLPDDDWLNCVGDQVNDGYDGENSIQICTSLRDAYLKFAMEDEDDDKDNEDMEKDMYKEGDEDEDTVFENEDDEIEEEVDEFDTDSEEDSLEEIEPEMEDDDFETQVEPEEDGLEEVLDEEVLDEDLSDEDSSDFVSEQEIDVQNITHIDIYGETPDGEEFEVEIPVNGPGSVESPIGDEDPDILEIEESFEGTPEDVIEVMDSESGMEPEEDFDVDMTEDEDEDFGLKNIFTMPEDFEDEDEDEDFEMEDEDEEIKSALNLRSGRVSSSNNNGGGFLNDENLSKLAQAIGLSMPLDTKAKERGVDIPRDEEEHGIRDDGEVASSSEYENSAKKMRGTKDGNAAGSSLSEDPAIQGAERGVRQVEPEKAKAANKNSWLKVSEYENTEKRTKKHPVSPTPNDDGSKECCEEDYGKTNTDSQKKNSNPDKKRTKVHFKNETKVEAKKDEEKDDHSNEKDKEGKTVEHKRHDKKNDKKKKNKEEKDIETGGSYCKKETKLKASKNPFLKGAQNNSSQQEEPVDSLQEDKTEENSVEPSLDIPRNESKAKPQEIDNARNDVNRPDEIRGSEYDMGPNAKSLHNEKIIPRDKSGDGVGGDSTSFEDEKAKGATSGKPDDYVQEFQYDKYIDPTPSGSEDNHGTMGVNTASKVKKLIEKFANKNNINVSDLEAVDFGDSIVVEQLSTGRLFELKPKN